MDRRARLGARGGTRPRRGPLPIHGSVPGVRLAGSRRAGSSCASPRAAWTAPLPTATCCRSGAGCACVHLPGHTRGHCGFYSARHDLLFSGDLFASYFWNTHRPPPILNSVPERFAESFRRVADARPALDRAQPLRSARWRAAAAAFRPSARAAAKLIPSFRTSWSLGHEAPNTTIFVSASVNGSLGNPPPRRPPARPPPQLRPQQTPCRLTFRFPPRRAAGLAPFLLP